MIEKNNSNSFNNSIHSIRGISVVLILLFHIFMFQRETKVILTNSGLKDFLKELFFLGVPLFFFISGFVFLNSSFSLKKTLVSIVKAFFKRLLRIQIPIFINILISWGILLFLNYFFEWRLENDLFYPERFFANLFFYAPFTNYGWYNVVYWTMTIEIQFYILFFLIIPFISDKSIILFSSILLFVIGSIYTDSHYIFHYSPLFALGMLLSMYLSAKISFNLYLLGFIFTLIFGYIYLETIWMISVSFASLFCIFLNFKNKIIDFYGEISFSLYLTQGNTAVLFLTIAPFTGESPFSIKLIFAILAFAIATLGAWIFYIIIEKPSIKLLKKIMH
jgi:exopolysaccharide production protein ExoZ